MIENWTKKLYFIISSPRSGSSLLRNKLMDFSGICALPSDLRIVEFLKSYGLYPNWKVTKDDFQAKYREKHFYRASDNAWQQFFAKECRSHSEFLINVFGLYASYSGDRLDSETIFVEKSPNNIYHIDFLKTIFPEAKIIYLHRDPRDVVASLNTKWWSTHNTFTNAKRWTYEQQVLAKEHDYRIAYEDIADNPVESLKALLKYMDYKDLGEVDHNHSKDLQKQPNSIAEPGQAIHSGNKEKYLKTLSTVDKEPEIIETICKREMLRLSYSFSRHTKGFSFFRKMFFLGLEHYFNDLIKTVRGRRNY